MRFISYFILLSMLTILLLSCSSKPTEPLSNTVSVTCDPNPMTTGTTFTVKGRSLQTTKIEIFNSRGQLVKTLISGKGHSTRWNGTDNDGDRVYSGVYFYRLTTGKYSDTRKMILIL